MFIPNPDNKPEIDHIDTNKLNNRVDNLRWVTRKENLNNEITLKHYSVSNKNKGKSEYSQNKRSNSIKLLWKNEEYRNKVLGSRPKKYKTKNVQ